MTRRLVFIGQLRRMWLHMNGTRQPGPQASVQQIGHQRFAIGDLQKIFERYALKRDLLALFENACTSPLDAGKLDVIDFAMVVAE